MYGGNKGIMKKKVVEIILFWLILTAAAVCFAYPTITKLKAEKAKKELISTIEEAMKNSAQTYAKAPVQEADDTDTADDTDEAVVHPHVTLDPVEGTLEEIEEEEEQGYTAEQIAQARANAIAANLAKQNVIGLIEIESVDILEPVVEGTSKDNLKCAVGHVEHTNNFGEPGNCVLCAHNGGLYGVLFKYLKNVKLEDVVTITDADNNVYRYEVYDSFVVDPEEVWILTDLTDDDNNKLEVLTLFTCEKNGKKRRVIRCMRLDDVTGE